MAAHVKFNGLIVEWEAQTYGSGIGHIRIMLYFGHVRHF
jgi:hypothetical protein